MTKNQLKELKTNVDSSPAEPTKEIIKSEKIEIIDIASVVMNPKNANVHPKEQIDELCRLINFQGFRNPIVISKRTGFLLAGHGRIEALKQLGWKKVPAIFQEFENEAQEYAYLISDNEIARWARLDYDSIHLNLQEFPELDTSLLGIEGFKLDMIQDEEGQGGSGSSTRQTLVEKFLIPPFSVFDTRQGYWQRRIKHWINMGINDTNEGRKDGLTFRDGDDFMGKENAKRGTTSVFDPALAEILVSWFSPKAGYVVDPFAGGPVRGVVTSKLERQYIGIDLRQEQVDVNRKVATQICSDMVAPLYIVGDSRNIHESCKDVKADMIFSCPPYADLEKYSDNPADLSNMKYEDFKEAYFDIIKKSCDLLQNDSFAVFVVGEVRDSKGTYYNFVGDTINAFQAAGLKYYNEIILFNQSGTGALRCERQMKATRKVVKVHQNVLVFVKGDAKKATLRCGEIEVKAIKDVESNDQEEL